MALLKEQISKFNYSKLELDFKNNQENVQIKKLKDIKLSNNKFMNKYEFLNGFYNGMINKTPGGYMDFHQNNLLVLSSHGILAYINNINEQSFFIQIENNINDFIGLQQFQKNLFDFSLRDLFIYENKIFISYIEEIKEDCWNTSVMYGNMNYERIKFNKLFSSEKCIHTKNTEGFGGAQTGGRIEILIMIIFYYQLAIMEADFLHKIKVALMEK